MMNENEDTVKQGRMSADVRLAIINPYYSYSLYSDLSDVFNSVMQLWKVKVTATKEM